MVPTKSKTVQEEHEQRLVRFNVLHFDPVNPRRDPMEDELQIRSVLCSDEGVLKLAEHMAEHGQNPLDRLAVIDHPNLPGHYVVPEGNRRLCAMQLLRDPDRAPTTAARKLFEKLRSAGRPVADPIGVVWFRDRELARVWMSVKHEGEQGGIGTVQWDANMKTRHNRQGVTSGTRPKNPNLQAESLLEYAVAAQLITSTERDLIALTTITRYLPNVRSALALLNRDDCTTNANQSEFNAALQRFLRDALPSDDPKMASAVHSRSQAGERTSYGENLRQKGYSPTERSHEPYDPAKTPRAPPAKKQPTGRSASHPDRRNRLIISGFVVSMRDPVLLRMVKEGKELDPDQARFSCNYLNRAILERVVHLYAKKHGVGISRELEAVIGRCVDHASKQANPPTRGVEKVLRTAASDKHAAYAPDTLGNGVHGGRIPSAADNRSNWESLQPALEFLLSTLR